jgi:transcriptional regulator with XRE-family HTH domain
MKKFLKLNHSIIERIDELRKAQGLSWTRLAEVSDISLGNISEIRNELIEAKFSTLCKLAIGLNMHPKDFFYFDMDLSELDV